MKDSSFEQEESELHWKFDIVPKGIFQGAIMRKITKGLHIFIFLLTNQYADLRSTNAKRKNKRDWFLFSIFCANLKLYADFPTPDRTPTEQNPLTIKTNFSAREERWRQCPAATKIFTVQQKCHKVTLKTPAGMKSVRNLFKCSRSVC